MMLHRSVHLAAHPWSEIAFVRASILLAGEYDEICWNALNERRLKRFHCGVCQSAMPAWLFRQEKPHFAGIWPVHSKGENALNLSV
jgi:hypothetical protein